MAYNKVTYVDGVTPLNANTLNKNEIATEQLAQDVESMSSAIVEVDNKIEQHIANHPSGDSHTHANKIVLDGISQSKVTEWNNKSNFDGNYNSLTNKPTIPTVDVNKAYVDTELAKKSPTTHTHTDLHTHANKTVIDGISTTKVTEWDSKATTNYVDTKIAEAQLGGGEVDLSGYATKTDLETKVDKVSGKGLSTNDYTSAEKTKLAGLSNYTHPNDANTRHVTDAEKTTWNAKANASHTHVKTDITDFSHRHNASEIDGLGSGGDVDLTGYATETFVMDKLGGKKHVYLTQAEYDALSETEKNDDTVVYGITDAEDTDVADLKLTGSKLDLVNKDGVVIGNGVTLPASGGGSNITVENNLTSTSATNALAAAQGKVLDDKITVLNTKIGDLSRLNTTNKSNLVDVINELLALINDNPSIPSVSVTGVTLDKTSLSINVGDTATLLATVLPSNATNKNITWSTSNDTVLSVNNGLVTAKTAGSATITVSTVDGNKTASCSVVVNQPSTSGFDISYLKLERDANQLTMPNELLLNSEIDVVHPSVLYFEDGWNGFKYWMAINPYPKTQSGFENPCMIVSNNGTDWQVKGSVPIYGVMPEAVHNSDCHIFMDGNTMVYINRGATSDDSCMIEYFTSTDGITWSERVKIIDKGDHNYLSPTVCKYNNKYYMFVYNSRKTGVDDYSKRITVLESNLLNGTWTQVNTIYCPNVPSIWHLEVKYIDGEFITLIMTGAAQGGNLSLGKFKTPLDSELSDYIVSPVIIPSGKTGVEAQLYKSSFIKLDNNNIEVFVNSKSTGGLDAFCHWSLNRSRLVNSERSSYVSEFTVEKTISNTEFVSGNVLAHLTTLTPYYNYEVDFKISKPSDSHVALSTVGTSDFMYLGCFSDSCYFAYIKSGNVMKKINITYKISTDSIITFVRDNSVCSLYVDGRLVGSIDEKEFSSSSPNYFKRAFGVCTEFKVGTSRPININDISYCKIKSRPSESVDLVKANEELQSEISNYSINPSQYYLFDDFNRTNGTLSTSTNGIAYTTDTSLPQILNNQCKIQSGGVKAIADIGSSNFTIYTDLLPSMNGHLIYLKYIDSNNFIACSFGNNKIGVVNKVSGTETRKDYFVFNSNTEKYILKIDVRNNLASIKCNNQIISSNVDISQLTSTRAGIGSWLSNSCFDTFIIKK